MKTLVVILSLSLCVLPTRGWSVNLVSDPGFEGGGTGWSFLGNAGVTASHAHTGSFAGYVDAPVPNSSGAIRQGIDTTPGHHYLVSFWVLGDGAASGELFASFAGTAGFGETDLPLAPYTRYSFVVPASAEATLFKFEGRHVSGTYWLDDVSITDLGPVSASIVAWGDDLYGQCDAPASIVGFTAIEGGDRHSLALRADSSVAAWGNNLYGQTEEPVPNQGFVAIAAGALHNLALKADGSIVAWGSNLRGQCDVPPPNSGFIAIAAGDYHSLGLRGDGSVAAWGYNADGACDVPPPNSGFTAIAAGSAHSLGLNAGGAIVAWGWNGYGQCTVPPPNAGFTAVKGGAFHSLGLKADSSIVAWGDNSAGQCAVPGPNSDFVAGAAGDQHTLGLRAGGTVVPWGSDDHGQGTVPLPNAEFLAVAAGSMHSLGLRDAPLGVCCSANGVCTVTAQTGCAAPDQWRSDQLSCEPYPCSPSAQAPGSTMRSSRFAASPNPFTGSVALRFAVARGTAPRVTVFDAGGRQVRAIGEEIVEGTTLRATWDGRDDAGRLVPAGLYLLRVGGTSGDPAGRIIKIR